VASVVVVCVVPRLPIDYILVVTFQVMWVLAPRLLCAVSVKVFVGPVRVVSPAW
jgi:hypothetical protein